MNRTISAVFIDRDGVINQYLRDDYVKRVEEMIVIPGIAGAIKRLNDAGIPVIIISNQQGVGKGLMSVADLEMVHSALRDAIKEVSGGLIDAIYYCPHLASDACNCRKPKPGLFLQARDDLGLDLTRSVMVGDSATDMHAAASAGLTSCVLVLSGATRYYRCGQIVPEPDIVCADLTAAVAWIMDKLG